MEAETSSLPGTAIHPPPSVTLRYIIDIILFVILSIDITSRVGAGMLALVVAIHPRYREGRPAVSAHS